MTRDCDPLLDACFNRQSLLKIVSVATLASRTACFAASFVFVQKLLGIAKIRLAVRQGRVTKYRKIAQIQIRVSERAVVAGCVACEAYHKRLIMHE